MLKIRGDTICKPLELIFKQAFTSFYLRRKFERLIFNKMFSFFQANNLLAPNQSGFKPGNSCINWLLSITHEIYLSFDDGFKVGSVFFDVSKFWHKRNLST